MHEPFDKATGLAKSLETVVKAPLITSQQLKDALKEVQFSALQTIPSETNTLEALEQIGDEIIKSADKAFFKTAKSLMETLVSIKDDFKDFLKKHAPDSTEFTPQAKKFDAPGPSRHQKGENEPVVLEQLMDISDLENADAQLTRKKQQRSPTPEVQQPPEVQVTEVEIQEIEVAPKEPEVIIPAEEEQITRRKGKEPETSSRVEDILKTMDTLKPKPPRVFDASNIMQYFLKEFTRTCTYLEGKAWTIISCSQS